jgi:hypothetical protein
LNAQEHDTLNRCRIATLGSSFDNAIIKAIMKGDTAGAAALEAEKAKDVAAEKVRLGVDQ